MMIPRVKFSLLLAAPLAVAALSAQEAVSIAHRCTGMSCDDGACEYCLSGWASRCDMCAGACTAHPCAAEAEPDAWEWQYGLRKYRMVDVSGKLTLLDAGELDESWLQIDVDDIRGRIEAFVSRLEKLPPIPKVVHVSWKTKAILNSTVPRVVNCGVRKLVELNPEYAVQVNDDADVEAYLKAKLDAFNYGLIRDRHIVEKVCLWQLLKLYHEGGVYVDIDRPHNTPLREILQSTTRFMLAQIYTYMWTQDAMISSAGNPIFLLAIKLNLMLRQMGWKGPMALGPGTWHCAVMVVLTGKCLAYSEGASNPERHALTEGDRDVWTLDGIMHYASTVITEVGARSVVHITETTQYNGDTIFFRLGPEPNASFPPECVISDVLQPREDHWTAKTRTAVAWVWPK